VLAQARPELSVVLLEARERRCRFLREAVEALGLSGRADVIEERAETAARRPDLREAIDVVVARSFGPPAVTAECAVGFLRAGGYLVVSEPPPETAQFRWDEDGLEALGLSPPVPGDGVGGGTFVRLEKLRLDERWPRRVGIPAKRPLW